MGDQRRGRAVVLGGSMAGLLAARVLAESYAEVTLVDRDVLTGVAGPRRGVPQGRHVHRFLSRGQEVVEGLFPGFTADLVAAGAVTGDASAGNRLVVDGRQIRQGHAGRLSVSVSRPTLERVVRERVRALPRVRFLERHDILGLRTTVDRARVTGVTVASRDRTDGAERALDADLVVDTTGRGSRTPAWLEQLGYGRVEEEAVKIGLGYATRHFRLPADPFPGLYALDVVYSPAHPRGGICAKIDGGRTVVTTYGILGDAPPTDPDGFLDFLKSLSTPGIYEALRGAEPLDNLVGYRFPANLRRRYERLAAFPAGLLVLGDAVCSFNPTYAQGITVAALGALTLRRHTASGRTPEAGRYFRDLARDAVDTAWSLAVGNDLGFPGVEGERTEQTRAQAAYMARVLDAATRDADIALVWGRVLGLVDPPEALMSPEVSELLRLDAERVGAGR
ncbi:FAD-binding monooxygenase [Streptomyces sp. B1866]|uniref:FAD-dependent oxidoreductase n=1 Tax=Streptomyces sp. B1866 TaxID=3075431 RepID=UPI00288D950F|nr:FAD-binding monooxygenase [Streptomyces sp. B1866]MDT3399935.1 FAD-binding monooxygenase [Streptomyces sp. B1866]